MTLSPEARAYVLQNPLARHLLLQMTRADFPRWGLVGNEDTLKGTSYQEKVVFEGSLARALPHIAALEELGLLVKRTDPSSGTLLYAFPEEERRRKSPDREYRDELERALDRLG